MNLYDMLFADQDLEDILVDAEFPPGSPLDVARARMWEGNYTDAALAAQGAPEPWSCFVQSAARMRAGLGAKHLLLPLAEDAFKESRARLWAWHALRKLGEKPSAVHTGEVLGFILEVPIDGSLDVLAAYADGSARFMGHADQLIVREPNDPEPPIAKVISEAFALLSVPPKPRDADADGPPDDRVRMFALSALGTHMVEVPWSDVEAGGKYAALFGAATQLLKFLTEDS
ncbi:MAG: hypothetical protein U0414_13365 [Polyangiaceae bacterium]